MVCMVEDLGILQRLSPRMHLCVSVRALLCLLLLVSFAYSVGLFVCRMRTGADRRALRLLAKQEREDYEQSTRLVDLVRMDDPTCGDEEKDMRDDGFSELLSEEDGEGEQEEIGEDYLRTTRNNYLHQQDLVHGKFVHREEKNDQEYRAHFFPNMKEEYTAHCDKGKGRCYEPLDGKNSLEVMCDGFG